VRRRSHKPLLETLDHGLPLRLALDQRALEVAGMAHERLRERDRILIASFVPDPIEKCAVCAA
jgi:hypothetical protein